MCLRYINQISKCQSKSEAGNVFLAIFGAIALVGLLGASIMTFMKGPLATSVRLTKMNTAENQMSIGAQVAVMATANQANNGDCDSDNFVEPLEWRAATTEPHPINGGLIPLSLGISKKDPWGTEYGYCVWNHGPTTTGAGCNTNMLEGTNSRAYPVVALISAGSDKIFSTTCRSFAAADTNSNGTLTDPVDLPLVSKASETDDDIITAFTYEEATGISGGLWSIKSTDPGTAVINKGIETSGVANLKGGILLPDKSFIDCTDPLNAGVMAKNGATGIEICDGAGNWTAITGGATGNNLVLTPVVSSGMNVTAPCGTSTCYSSNVTFTLTNKAATTSPVLASSLSNLTNFEFVSNGCNGITLAANAECQMVVRAKGTGNLSYTGTLNITGSNSPFATLDGTASGFAGCNAGGQTTGGYYVACGIGGYDLIVTPSGCSGGMTNPTCNGSTDTLSLAARTGESHGHATGCCTSSDGQKHTASLMAYSQGAPTQYPAAAWCSGLVYAGFDDWFLPSATEMTSYFYPNRATVGWSNATHYWTSNEIGGYPNQWSAMLADGTIIGGIGNNVGLVRCMRWSPSKAVLPVVDTTPMNMSFNTSYGAPTVTRTSNTVTILGVTQPISISVSGGVDSKYSINGGAYTSVTGTVNNGDQITLQSTAPAKGQENIISLTTGTSIMNWVVRTAGDNTIRVFTTGAVAGGGNFGGVGGADALCTTRATAAGLPGTWVAVMMSASTSVPLETRLPWNWTILKNMNGATVATGLADFLDGSISAPMNYAETGVLAGGSRVWTGIYFDSGTFTGSAGTCSNWANGASSTGRAGDTSQTGSGSYLDLDILQACLSSYRLLCMETNAAGEDLDPDTVQIVPQVVFSAGATGISNVVTVTGVTDSIPVSISSSTGATVGIIKGGVTVGASTTTAGLNETLAFTMTGPATIGTKSAATITLGSNIYSWWVGYGDSTKEARVFVTSTTTTANLGGVEGADAVCSTLAATSVYAGAGAWKAIISNSTVNAADRIPWTWKTLKNVAGDIVIDNGFADLWDGTLDGPMNLTEAGLLSSNQTWTGTGIYGTKKSGSEVNLVASNFCNDWTSTPATLYTQVGFASSITAQWTAQSSIDCYNVRSVYCIEDVDGTTDVSPDMMFAPYKVQVALGSRQTSDPVIVRGMSIGATQSISIAGASGTPRVKINGGGEVTSGTIKNGDSLVFVMDAPATGNTSNRMTITTGATVSYWRVWTGDTTGTAVKRAFVLSVAPALSSNVGGVTGLDARCQTAATNAALGGTWKAIVSGIGNSEPEWAVNRVGYNWSTLRRIDGQDIVLAGNLWQTDVTPLLNPIAITETGVTLSTSYVKTGSTTTGMAAAPTALGQCVGWSYSTPAGTSDDRYNPLNGSSGAIGSFWINNNTTTSAGYGYHCISSSINALYCIEQ